jgi:hypothetical protein
MGDRKSKETVMGLPLRFRTQWAKVKRSNDRFENAEHELRVRDEGYRDEGVYFSENKQGSLLNGIEFWRKRRAIQSVELLKLHDRMLESGNAVDPGFDRKVIEVYARS